MAEITLNGERREISAPTALPDLLESMGIGIRWVLVERNGEPVNRTDYDTTMIRSGDRLEIATPMAGG